MTPEELKEWRKNVKLSQAELGELLGVTSKTIWRWESGEAKIPVVVGLAVEALEARFVKSEKK